VPGSNILLGANGGNPMIRIDMTCQDTRHPDKRLRHQGQASCDVAGRRFETEGPAPIYRLSTLLWLHGHVGAAFEVYDDVSPTGKPGGLAMTGRVRNWASFKTPKGMPMFRMKSKPAPDFTPEQRTAVAKAAGVVVSCDVVSQDTPTPGRGSFPSDGPQPPPEKDDASTGVYGTQTPEAA
jgi:hypothetical protein